MKLFPVRDEGAPMDFGCDCRPTSVGRSIRRTMSHAIIVADGARTADIASPGQPTIGTVEMGTRIAEVAATIEIVGAAKEVR